MKNLIHAALALALSSGAAIAAQPASSEPARPQIDFAVYAQPQRLVRLKDGRRMNLHCTGAGSPTVILEGGWSTTTIWWRDIQAALSPHTRVCSYDRAGYGFSDAGPMPRTASAIASDLHALLTAAKVRGPYVLVAHSLGGLDVRLFADKHPGKVAGMVLIDPTVEHQVARLAKASTGYGEQMNGFVSAVTACAKGVIDGTIKADMPASRICISPPSKSLPASINAARRAEQLTAAYQRTAMSELTSLDASARELDASRRSYGRMPLIVLTAEKANTDPSLSAEEQAALDKAAWDLHAEVAGRSSRGQHRLVKGASHFIPKDEPKLTVDTILELVEATRKR